jgi:hypothetical protein
MCGVGSYRRSGRASSFVLARPISRPAWRLSSILWDRGWNGCQGELCAAQRSSARLRDHTRHFSMVELTWKQWIWASTSRSTLMQGAGANKLRSASGAPTPHRSQASLSKNKLGTQCASETSSAEIRRHKTWVSQQARHRRRRRGPAAPLVSPTCSATTKRLGLRCQDPAQGCSPPARCCPARRNISFDTRAVSVSPPLLNPRTLSNAIWHLASAKSMLTHAALWHPQESGPTIRRGPSFGIHFTQANSAANSNNIRGGGTDPHDSSAMLPSLDEMHIPICMATSAGLG